MEEKVYKPGEPVWVKHSHYPWWPAIVISLDQCPLTPRANAKLIACIQFVPEEEFTIVYSPSKIDQWNDERTEEYIMKAQAAVKKKESLRPMFEKALHELEANHGVVVPKINEKKPRHKAAYCIAVIESMKKAQSEANAKASAPEESPIDGDKLVIGSDSDEKKRVRDIDASTSNHQTKKMRMSPRKKLAKDLDNIVIDTRKSVPWDENLEVDACDESESESLVTLPSSQPGNQEAGDEGRVCGIDSDSSDDEDLPDVLSSCSKEPDPVKEGTLLWVKYRNWPYWPALVKNCYRKKKVLKKVSLVFIGDVPLENEPGSTRACLTYNKKNMVAFADQERHSQLKTEGLKSQYATLFHEAVSKADDYIIKKCLKKADSPFVFFAEDISKATGGPDPLLLGLSESEEEKEGESDTRPEDNASSRTEDESQEDSEGEEQGYESEEVEVVNYEEESDNLKKRRVKRRERAERIIEMVKEPWFKSYLIEIFKGERECERHRAYLLAKRKQTKIAMQNYGFGPIDDDEQHMELLNVLTNYMKEVCPPKNSAVIDTSYVFSVWLPETIIYAMQKISKKTRNVVEENYLRGCIRTQEEIKIQTKEMREAARNIEPEVMAFHKEKIERKGREMFQDESRREQLLV